MAVRDLGNLEREEMDGDHDGTIDRLYDHWVLGKTAEPRDPRWSVVRNVFGWGVEAEAETESANAAEPGS